MSEELLHVDASTGASRVRLVFYEDLLAHTRTALDGLQRWLGVHPLPLSSEIAKLTDTNLSRQLTNFGQVEAHVTHAYGINSYEHKLLLQGSEGWMGAM